jgi:hypothetical protein
LRGCGCGFKKTAKPQLWFHFWNFLLCGAVAVVVLPQKRGCILKKSECLIYRNNCIIYRGGCKFTAMVAYFKNLRFWRLNSNRGFSSCLAVLVRLRCLFFSNVVNRGLRKMTPRRALLEYK